MLNFEKHCLVVCVWCTCVELQSRKQLEQKRRGNMHHCISYGQFQPEVSEMSLTAQTTIQLLLDDVWIPHVNCLCEHLTFLLLSRCCYSCVYVTCLLQMEMREDSCSVCRRSGELLMCDVCSLVYHLQCLDPPLNAVPVGLWSCPKCQVRLALCIKMAHEINFSPDKI